MNKSVDLQKSEAEALFAGIMGIKGGEVINPFSKRGPYRLEVQMLDDGDREVSLYHRDTKLINRVYQEDLPTEVNRYVR